MFFSGVRLGLNVTVFLKNIQDTNTQSTPKTNKTKQKRLKKHFEIQSIYSYPSSHLNNALSTEKGCELRFLDSGEVFFNSLSKTKKSCTIM